MLLQYIYEEIFHEVHKRGWWNLSGDPSEGLSSHNWPGQPCEADFSPWSHARSKSISSSEHTAHHNIQSTNRCLHYSFMAFRALWWPWRVQLHGCAVTEARWLDMWSSNPDLPKRMSSSDSTISGLDSLNHNMDISTFTGRTCHQPSFPRWKWVPGVMFLTFLWPNLAGLRPAGLLSIPSAHCSRQPLVATLINCN